MGQVLKLMQDLPERQSEYPRIPFLPTPTPDILADVGELFLHLTSWTVPHGWELIYYGKMLTELGFQMDAHNNWWMQIGEAPSTCFMAHLDTACREARPITREIKEDFCHAKGSILGADDRAGAALILNLVSKDVPGLYYLFVGEEQGCVGSGKVAEEKLIPSHVTKAISFDRKGYHDIITHQCGARTCSDEFAEALAGQLNEALFRYEACGLGLYTDSKEFIAQIAECTNISVGYENAHTSNEYQDLRFLRYLAERLPRIDWEALPVVREPADEFDWDVNIGWNHTDDDRYYSRGVTDYRNYSEYDHLGKELCYYGKPDPGGDAYDAIDALADNFELGFQADPGLIEKLLLKKKGDTVHIIALLLEELRGIAQRRDD